MDEQKKQKLEYFRASTLRDVVEFINQRGLQKDQILKLEPDDVNGFYLLYFT